MSSASLWGQLLRVWRAKGHGSAERTQALQLLPEAIDVALCCNARVSPGLNRILLCWQPKSVPPDRVQDIGTLLQHANKWCPSSQGCKRSEGGHKSRCTHLHALQPRHDVRGCVAGCTMSRHGALLLTGIPFSGACDQHKPLPGCVPPGCPTCSPAPLGYGNMSRM